MKTLVPFHVSAKSVGLFFLLILSLCTCKRDKAVDPEDYNGEYPYIRGTGKSIPTYQPQFISSWQVPPVTDKPNPVLADGQYAFIFNNHNWNHWPYINISLRITANPSAPFDRIDSRILGVGITAMSSYECSMESVNFVIPAQIGRFRFDQPGPDGSPFFHTFDCDQAKDHIVVDNTADNWVNVTRLDTLANQVEGSFDLNFTITRKEVSYSIIYPTQIRMRGSFNGLFTKW